MSLGDVFAFFGALLALGIAIPGMLLAWSLLFPGVVEKAQLRLTKTPVWCFWLGCAAMLLSTIVIGTLMRIPAGYFQMFAWLVVGLLLTVVSVGASGLAAVMGERLRGRGMPVSTPGALLRGALSLEMAAIFPLVGWFVVIPLSALVSLGAASFALLNWQPRPRNPLFQQAIAVPQQSVWPPAEQNAQVTVAYPLQQPQPPNYVPASSSQESIHVTQTANNSHTS